MSISKPDYIQVWLDNVFRENSQCKQTLVQYKQMFQKFLDFIEKTACDIIHEYETADSEQKTRRKYGRLVRAFSSYLQNNSDYAPSTLAKYIACVKSFFVYSDLPLPRIGLGRRIVVFGNRDIRKEEIIAILQNAKFLRDRAFFTIMAQSGLRPFELCNLKMENIEHSLDGAKQKSYLVTVPQQAAKGKYHEFFTFIPEETMQVLRDYWNTRTDPLNEESFVFVKERGRSVEPTNGGAMSQVFKKIAEKLERAGVISYKVRKGKPSQLRLYNLRKWFRKQAYQAGSDFVNSWMGHTNLDLEHYFSKDVDLHRKVYQEKAMPFLRIEEATPTQTDKVITELRERVASLEQRNAEMKTKLNGFTMTSDQMQKLLRRIEELEKVHQT